MVMLQDLNPGTYLKGTERLSRIEQQLSAPSRVKESSTPQPEEPLQIHMPTPTTTTALGTTVTTTSTTTATTPVAQPPQPKFGYHEVNVLSLSGLAPHVTINEQVLSYSMTNMGTMVEGPKSEHWQ